MGTRLPQNEPGERCFTCFGPGLTFGDVVTPKFVSLQLINLQQGEFWIPEDEHLLTTPHLLEQTPTACKWSITDQDYTFELHWDGALSIAFVVNNATGKTVHGLNAIATCLLSLTDLIEQPAGRQGFGSTAVITWSREGLD